jgi:spermidine synthase
MLSLLRKKRERLLFISITCLGISHIVTQLVVLREFLNVFHGNELVFGIILANWLLLMGVGSWVGKSAGRLKRKIETLIWLQVSIALLPILSIFMIRSLRVQIFMAGVTVDLASIIITSFMILLPYCIISGFLLTLACSVFSAKRTEEQIGHVYFIDNIGDILGGILFSFVLVFFLDAFQMALVMMFINLLAAIIMSNFIRKPLLAAAVSAILIISALALLSANLEVVTTAMMYPGQEVIEQRSSPYGKIVITRLGSQLNFFENGLPLFSTQDTAANEETVHYALVQHDDPEEVLLISGGVAGTVEEILKHGVSSIDYVELDPLLIRLGDEYTENLEKGKGKLKVINGDGRLYVKTAAKRYDAVIIDLPDPGTAQVNRFYSLEFFRELKEILSEGAVVTISLSSSINYMNPETVKLNSILYNTMGHVFSNVMVIPGDENHFIASDAELSYDIARMIREKGIPTSYVNENYMAGKLTQARIDYVIGSLQGEDAGLNTDFMPITYYYHLLYWMSHFELNFTPFVIAFAALVVFCIFFWRFNPISLSISTTGFVGAALEIVILIGFQILYGYVYQSIGIIVTSFMLGLALGAYKMNGWLKNRSKRDFLHIEISIIAYSLLLPLLLVFLAGIEAEPLVFISSQVIFPVLTLVLATLVGMQFPLAGKLHIRKKGVEKTAGTLYASDLTGACIGALLTAALLIPLIGIINVCILAALVKLFSGIIFWKA